MADEPSDRVAIVSDAHECNGDREGLACTDDSHSDAAIIDGATETVYMHRSPTGYLFIHYLFGTAAGHLAFHQRNHLCHSAKDCDGH